MRTNSTKTPASNKRELATRNQGKSQGLLFRCVLATGLVASAVATAPEAYAQSTSSPDVGEGVSAALFDRGMTLFEESDYGNAKKMFIESLERGPKGSRSADALRMLRSCNEKLGVADLDSGLPDLSQNNAPIDPYGDSGDRSDEPVDPYADPKGNPDDSLPVNPYAGDPAAPDDEPLPGDDKTDEANLGRYGLIGQGGVLGSSLLLTLGTTVLDKDADGEVDDLAGVVLGVAGAAGGAYLSHYLIERYQLSDGQSAAIATAGFWATYNTAHLANLFTGESSNLNDVYWGMSIGGIAGTGIGAWYAKKYEPDVREISLVNSLSLYGTTASLMLAVAIDPPKADAYALNALLGSVAGIGTAIYLRDDLHYSRSRMLKIDMGAGIGALVPWITIYPLTRDDQSTRDEQTVGFLSAMGVGIGAYIGWAVSKESADSDDEDQEELSLAAPALLRRSKSGSWSMSSPMLRPMELPAIAPRQGILGADIVSGRF